MIQDEHLQSLPVRSGLRSNPTNPTLQAFRKIPAIINLFLAVVIFSWMFFNSVVLAKCKDGTTDDCIQSGKHGTRVCNGGVWGPCEVDDAHPNCDEGEIDQCTVNGKHGTKTCQAGVWSACKPDTVITTSDLTILSANAMGSGGFDRGGGEWQTRIDRLANLVVNSGTRPDIISMTEFEGFRWCFPAWSAGDYDIADRLIWRLQSLTGVRYRIAYMVGIRGAFGFLDRCQYYSGDIVLYNPARLVNRNPEDATRFPQHGHDENFIDIQMRRSLPLCNRGTTLMPLDQLIDGQPQTDKCGRSTPSGPAWVVVPGRIGGSLVRFAFVHDPTLSFDVFTVHPRSGAEAVDGPPIANFINGLSAAPYRTTPRYYPPLVVGDFNSLVRPEEGQPEWPPGVSTVFSLDPSVGEPMAVKLGEAENFSATYSLKPVQKLRLPPGDKCPTNTDQDFSDHCALVVRFTHIKKTENDTDPR